MLSYDQDLHLYKLNGKPIPGVTEVLSASGYYKGEAFFTEASRLRGQAVHTATQLIDQHFPDRCPTLDEVQELLDLGDSLIPYVNGYLLFRRESGFQPLRLETQVFSRYLNVAGTFDKWGLIGGAHTMIDVKTWVSGGSKPQRSAEIQLALYAYMARESLGLETKVRMALKLSGDNRYRSYICCNHIDEAIGVCACQLYWDRRNHGLLEE